MSERDRPAEEPTPEMIEAGAQAIFDEFGVRWHEEAASTVAEAVIRKMIEVYPIALSRAQ